MTLFDKMINKISVQANTLMQIVGSDSATA